MNFNCIVSDSIARLNNARSSDRMSANLLCSKQVEAILRVLLECKAIERFEVADDRRAILVHLCPKRGFRKLRASSTPGRVWHVQAKKIPFNRQNDFRIISTSSGMMTTATAREKRVGGKLMVQVFL